MKVRARARQWLHYGGDLLAPLCRRFAGSITPVIPWRHYAEDLVAPLRRRRIGSIMPAIHTEHVKRFPHVITPTEERAQKRYWESSRWGGSVEYPTIPRYDFAPTDTLTIEVGRWPLKSSWKDTPRTRLEQRLSRVSADIIDLARQTHAKQLEEARRKEAHRRALAQYETLTKRRANEAERFKQLELHATNWERATRLRDYATAVEREAVSNGRLSAEQVDWLSWARAKADWVDPLVQVSDPILDGPEPQRPGFG